MKNFKSWLKAIRLKTLPLAVGGILLGSFLAAYEYSFSSKIFSLLIVTAVLLQILSNLANDYGDYKKGTDISANREDRMLSSGKISEYQMKAVLTIVSILAFIFGVILLITVFNYSDLKMYLWLIIGIAAIVAALKYTIGKNPYGYYGWGDLAVFVFFGIISVFGAYYLLTNRFTPNIIVPSVAWGLLCVVVLNINNIRDIENDKISGKKTFALILGLKNAKIYLYSITVLSVFLFALFSRLTETSLDILVPIFFLSFYIIIFRNITAKNPSKEDFNKALRNISLLNLMLVLILGLLWLS
ncbi:MAG: 1,4-dihydroxy-2-naphthoate octaprenyltransferase [Bacteroidia bacterium]|nr:1,4-dihydroxy-2-naphthoate octaprenyltransferase [Bacteroidia bacterium]